MYPSIITNSLEINTSYLRELIYKVNTWKLNSNHLTDNYTDHETFHNQIQLAIFDKLLEIWVVKINNDKVTMTIKIDHRLTLI